ncbi:unnamed protein product [marine sediment metagenome]|uniref:OB domain-containing protein n=1 Tax=marine sediment metagenome TaxID=412755 RepID=X1UBT5_9ZZZZ
MSKFLKANEIINKGSESRYNFQFLSKMQIFSQTTSTTRHGKPYLVISMRDITGNISNINKWIDNNDDLEKYQEILKIGNVVEIYSFYSTLQIWILSVNYLIILMILSYLLL